jgi:Calcineurin-like phosphoesterase
MPRGANEVPNTKMIGWYDPLQLMRTAGEVIISTLFARHVDDRRIQGLVQPKKPFIDENFRDADGSIGLDFVADTGDGWNSTYAVARAVADDDLAVVDDAGTQIRLPRGMLLVLGGDLVYPTPSDELYAERLYRPFDDALSSPPPRPPYVLAIPGNHDWYDSLVAFRRLFCAGEPFGAWCTQQERSYFAARLSKQWWLLGVDVQLDHDIDDVQFKYFHDLASEGEENDKDPGGVSGHMAHDARVIICCAEPYWASAKAPTLLGRLIDDSLRQRVRIIVAGDLHHYRRHRSSDKSLHFVTCGTGGAFLHPTHELPAAAAPGLQIEKCYPTESESKRLTFLNLGFIWINPKFGIVPAIAYLLVAWATGLNIGESFASGVQLAEIGRLGLSQTWDAVIVAIHSALLSPIGAGLYIFIGVYLLCRRRIEFVPRDRRPVAHARSHRRRLFDILAGDVPVDQRAGAAAQVDTPIPGSWDDNGAGWLGRRLGGGGTVLVDLPERLWTTFERSVQRAADPGLEGISEMPDR